MREVFVVDPGSYHPMKMQEEEKRRGSDEGTRDHVGLALGGIPSYLVDILFQYTLLYLESIN